MQTALVRSWPRWERIRRRDDPEIYVRRAMVNSWTSWRRRRWWGERATDAAPDRQVAGDLAAEAAVRITVQRALKSLPARLPGRQRLPGGDRGHHPQRHRVRVRISNQNGATAPTDRAAFRKFLAGIRLQQ